MCFVPLEDASYGYKENIFCKSCFESNFTATCRACKKPIAAGGIKRFLHHPYHLDCFKCHNCEVALMDKKIFDFEQKLYCEGCEQIVVANAKVFKCDVCL